VRVLLLTRYDRLGASSRLRSLQFLPWLARAGIDVEVQPLLPNAYLQDLYQGRKDYRYAVGAYLGRYRSLGQTDKFDLLWIEKELFPWLPYWTESSWLDGPPAILDMDDAIFHNYDLSKNLLVRSALGNKIDRLIARVNLVTVGSDYLAERATAAGAQRIERLPTVVDLDRYPLRIGRQSYRCVIGWIGTPQTASYLFEVEGALAQLASSKIARTVLIGSGPISLRGVPTEIHSWFEDTEQEKVQLIDIGIMPLPDAPWERGKCGYKLIQYMASGVPVVASPVGANKQIIDHGVNGFLASTESEWIEYLSLLAASPPLRARMGAAGRAKVESQYCTRVIAPRLVDLIKSVANMSRAT
jgi:glycosyltransferase involved in cell wall biosynthesis